MALPAAWTYGAHMVSCVEAGRACVTPITFGTVRCFTVAIGRDPACVEPRAPLDAVPEQSWHSRAISVVVPTDGASVHVLWLRHGQVHITVSFRKWQHLRICAAPPRSADLPRWAQVRGQAYGEHG